jgi:hypothetical protein
VKEPSVIRESLPVPVFGRDGEPCPGCGAPLAGDQRYCLHCGARRPEARLEFLDVLDADVRTRSAGALAAIPPPGGAAGYAGVGGPTPHGLNARLQANSGLLGLSGLLVMTLLVGLLVGHWATSGSTPQAAAPVAPQVIKLDGTAAAPAAAAPVDTGAATAGGSASSSAKPAKSAKSAASAATTAKAPKGAVSVKKLGDKKAIDDAVKKGKPITTGTGKLPPKDGKAPGNGSSIQVIG